LPRHGSAQTLAPRPRSVRLFAALGDETRLRLVSRLCHDGPSSITGLTEGFRITRQAITNHLRVMEDAGLVRQRRRGRETVWQVSPRRLHGVRRYLEQISRQWDAALERLRTHVEEDAR
jgi:DNA-binding transcriptional ArsR family regulator